MNSALRTMYAEYGVGTGTCERCCNIRKHPTQANSFICMAYGYAEGQNCVWDLKSIGCGLRNKPFLAISPKRRPLVELTTPRKKSTKDDNQESLF